MPRRPRVRSVMFSWPVNLLSTLGAMAGAGLVFYSVGFEGGEVKLLVWAAVAFVAVSLLKR